MFKYSLLNGSMPQLQTHLKDLKDLKDLKEQGGQPAAGHVFKYLNI